MATENQEILGTGLCYWGPKGHARRLSLPRPGWGHPEQFFWTGWGLGVGTGGVGRDNRGGGAGGGLLGAKNKD